MQVNYRPKPIKPSYFSSLKLLYPLTQTVNGDGLRPAARQVHGSVPDTVRKSQPQAHPDSQQIPVHYDGSG